MVALVCDQLGNFYKQYSKFHDHFNDFIFFKDYSFKWYKDS